TVGAVMSGTFQYRTTQGSAVLAPGAMLLGNHGHGFACGHEHSTGDRCLAFHVDGEYFDALVGDAGGESTFSVASVPPLASLAPLLAEAEVASDNRDKSQLEGLAAGVLGAVASALAGGEGYGRRKISPADLRRVSDVIRWIDAHSEQPIALEKLARRVAMSPFHFLRTFREVAGVTPPRYLLRTRLRRVCVALRTSQEAVSALAFEAGFSDLSTFNRQFRRIVGSTPGEYRSGVSRGCNF